MKKALLLAVDVRSRQYYDLMRSCLVRPGEAVHELLERPAHWWPGAALIVAAASLAYQPGFTLLLSPLVAMFLAVYCRPKAGAFRWGTWMVLWGYGLLPWLATYGLFMALKGLIILTVYGVKWTLGVAALKAIASSFNAASTPVVVSALAVIAAFCAFTALRLVLTMVRAATRSSWAYAAGLSLLALVSGAAFSSLLSPLTRALHG